MDTNGKLMVRNNKGIATVYIALLIVALIGLVGIAVDFGYMYVVKGQLQNAADAAALAGAVKLTGNDTKSNDLVQKDAREEAWEFACRNKAAGENVYIDIPSNPNPTPCDQPPNTNQLNDSNSATGPIIVGNWNVDTKTFTRATGSTGLPINAMVVNAARTSSARGGPVGIFFGRVLSPIWNKMGAAASAGALKTNISIFGIPLCNKSCGVETSMNVAQSPNETLGTRFYLKIQDDPTYVQGDPNSAKQTSAWTAYFDVTNKPNVIDYINGTKQPPNICKECIKTTQGDVVPVSCELLDVINRYKKTYYVPDGAGGTWPVVGMKGLLPILDPAHTCPGGHSGCASDPGNQPGDPFYVFQYAEVILTDSIPESHNCRSRNTTGGPGGIVIVGTAPSGKTGVSVIGCGDCSLTSTVQPNIGSVLFDWFGAIKVNMN